MAVSTIELIVDTKPFSDFMLRLQAKIIEHRWCPAFANLDFKPARVVRFYDRDKPGVVVTQLIPSRRFAKYIEVEFDNYAKKLLRERNRNFHLSGCAFDEYFTAELVEVVSNSLKDFRATSGDVKSGIQHVIKRPQLGEDSGREIEREPCET